MRCIPLVLGACLIASTVFAQTPPPEPTPAPNCMAANNAYGVFCDSTQACCGAGTMSPQCVANGGDQLCCTHYKAARTCNSTQTCCGGNGPGASSYATCCDAGSTCCQTSPSYSGASTCCGANSKCCRGGGAAYCCPSDHECAVNSYTCIPPATPTPAATPAAGSHRVCAHYSAGGVGTFYDITADATQTVMKRYNTATSPATLLDVNTYAAVSQPDPAGSNWDAGVAFAATMQTRNAWMYDGSQQTSAAYWDVLGADGDRWRFQAPGVLVTLSTQDCAGFNGESTPPPAQATPQPPSAEPTAAPVPPSTSAPAPPAGGSSHHVCLHYSSNGVGTYYDIVADGSQTVLKRYNTATSPATLLDTNTYAALAMPDPQGSAFDVGVAFAATMQTRGVWMYAQELQTTAAYWDVLGADGDRWRFQTSAGEFQLATQNCMAP